MCAGSLASGCWCSKHFLISGRAMVVFSVPQTGDSGSLVLAPWVMLVHRGTLGDRGSSRKDTWGSVFTLFKYSVASEATILFCWVHVSKTRFYLFSLQLGCVRLLKQGFRILRMYCTNQFFTEIKECFPKFWCNGDSFKIR